MTGITISQLTGNELFKKVQLAKERSENGEQLENERLSGYESEINNYLGGSRESFNESKLLLTVTETSWTEFEIPNLDSYKCFMAYIHYIGSDQIISEITFWPEQLKNAKKDSTFISPVYYDGRTYIGSICYESENKINACVSGVSKMTIYGIK